MTDLSPGAERAVRQVEKLLRLAAKHPTEAEGIAAANKAQQLLEAYNLDMATVEAASGAASGKREDEKLKGGLYHYQRDLWEAVAKLNFCMYWNQYVYDKEKVGRRKARYSGLTVRTQGGYSFRHRIVGRVVNVVGTKVMAQYLEQTIERLTRERLQGDGSQFFTRWAISYREGIAERIVRKIEDRRADQVQKERKEQRQRDKATQDAARAGASTATAMTISSLTKSEHDANIDFVYGDGTSAQWAADRAETARLQAEADAEYTAWAKANPEEAAKAAEDERKRERRQGYGRQSYRDRKSVDYGGFNAGYEAGDKVSLDQQVDEPSRRRIK